MQDSRSKSAEPEPEDLNMAESMKQDDRNDEKAVSGSDAFDYICQPCSGEDKKPKAAGYCIDCSELLCVDCLNYHPKVFMLKNHKLIDLEQMKKEGISIGNHDVCNKMCQEHKGKVIEYYCADHECLACGVCINLGHKNCPNVQYIPKVSESLAEGGELSSVMQKLNNIVRRTEEITEVSKRNLDKTEESYIKVLDEVEKVKKEAVEAFDKLKKEITEEIEKIKDEHSQKMDTNMKSCNEIQTKAKAMVSCFKSLKDSRQHCNLFVSIKEEQESMKKLGEQLDQVSDDNHIGYYLFRPSNCLKDFLSHRNMLGKILQQRQNATKVKEISLKVYSDENACVISGAAILGNNKMVVADCMNGNVKLINLEISEVQYVLDGLKSPWNVAKTCKESEIAVTTGRDKKLHLIKVRYGILWKVGEIKTPGSCFGVSAEHDNFIVSIMFPARLVLINRQGDVLKTIQFDSFGDVIFDSVYSVCVNPDTSTTYVADFGKSTVMSLSGGSNVSKSYNEKFIEGAAGVAIGKNGNVFVRYENSSMICQMTPDLKESCLVLSSLDGLVSPSSMAYCAETDQLFVGQDSGTILVYKLHG